MLKVLQSFRLIGRSTFFVIIENASVVFCEILNLQYTWKGLDHQHFNRKRNQQHQQLYSIQHFIQNMDFLQSMKNKTMRVVGSVRESMTPILKESQFNEKGVLTPDEFVKAGDLLVTRCPTWSWSTAPANIRVPYLPENKQYLVTRNIPCFERVSSLVGQEVEEEEIMMDEDGEGSDGGWLATHFKRDDATNSSSTLRGGDENEIVIDANGNAHSSSSSSSAGGIFAGVNIVEDYDGGKVDNNETPSGKSDAVTETIDAAATKTTTTTTTNATTETTETTTTAVISDDSDSDDYADLSSFEDMSLMKETDPSSLPTPTSTTTTTTTTPSSSSTTTSGETKTNVNVPLTKMISVSEPADTMVQCRRYDISITYDKYYQTPRVWLLGYDERGQPLNQEQLWEDIMQDYANKTVTIEKHPLIDSSHSSVHASIHPCRHASTMKKMIDILNDGEDTASGGGARVDMYLIIFLKFIQSVIPTMNYDFTIEVDSF